MKNEGTVVAIDIDKGKLLRLKTEMQRMGISIVSILCHNLDREFHHKLPISFDRILLDAPCSGLGVMRRNPDIKWQKSKRNLAKYKTLQLRQLENLSHIVKASGIFVYSVCSPEPEENEEVINEFLKKHKDFVIDKNPGRLPDEIGSVVAAEGFFKNLSKI